MRGFNLPMTYQGWKGKIRFLLRQWQGAKLVSLFLEKRKREQKVRTLLLRVVIPMKTLTTSPLILKTWKPHLLSCSSSHRLSLVHLLMLPIILTCFLIDSIISSNHRKLCKGRWTNIAHTPPHRWCIFKKTILCSPLRLETWRAWTSTFGHFD